MKLPVYQASTHKVVLPLSKKDVIFRPYTVEEEKVVLTAKEDQNKSPDELLRIFFELTQKCVQSPTDMKIEDLNIVDFSFLLISMREKSVGESIQLNYTCDECGGQQNITAKFEDCIIVQNEKNKQLTCEINSRLSFLVKVPDSKFLFELKNDMSEKDFVDVFILNATKSITFDNEVLTGFSKEELKTNIIDNFTTADYSNLADQINKLSKLSFRLEGECASCKKSIVMEEDNVMRFLS